MDHKHRQPWFRHDVKFVVTGGTGIWHKENLRCRQGRKSWPHDDRAKERDEHILYGMCGTIWIYIQGITHTHCNFYYGLAPIDKIISQFPPCIGQVSHNAPFCNRNVHTFPLQNGALRDMGLVHCGSCAHNIGTETNTDWSKISATAQTNIGEDIT